MVGLFPVLRTLLSELRCQCPKCEATIRNVQRIPCFVMVESSCLRRVFYCGLTLAERLIDSVTGKVDIGTKRHTCGLLFVPFWARYLLASNQV